MESFEQIYIGGKFVDTDDGKSYDNINPATEEPLGRAPDAQLSDTRRAIETARGSFDSGVWSDASLEERARVMRQIADSFEKYEQDIIDITVWEVGHPVRICQGFASASTNNARYLAELAGRDFGYDADPVMGAQQTTHRLVLREPGGVVSAILPYNAPIQVASYKALAAIGAGNSVVMKPSPLTPYSALIFAKIVAESDLPAGVLNVITAQGVDTGVELTESPLVDAGKVMVTPGGKKGAVVALSAKTGKRVWQSKDFTDGAQYSSLIASDFGGRRQYIQLTGASVVGLDAKSGDMLWRASRKGRTATVSTDLSRRTRLCQQRLRRRLQRLQGNP